MKPTQKTCKGCPHLIHNLHFPTGHQKLFCCLSAQYLNRLDNCPRQTLKITQTPDTIQKRKTR